MNEEYRDLLLRFRELGAVRLSPSSVEQEEMDDLLDKLDQPELAAQKREQLKPIPDAQKEKKVKEVMSDPFLFSGGNIDRAVKRIMDIFAAAPHEEGRNG